MNRTKEKLTIAEQEIAFRVAENLKKLIDNNDSSRSELCRVLEENGQISVDRSTLSKFLTNPQKYKVQLPFLISCADYFHVPIDALISEDINTYNIEDKIGENFKKTLDLPRLMAAKEQVVAENPLFIENPQSPFFEKYIQKYYCYYYSTVADENKEKDSIMSGEMEIYPNGNHCGVTLKINTKNYSDTGELNYKTYVGTAVISSATLAIHCTLREEMIGEYCYVIFRYSKLNFNKQDCRMALVLSTSSSADKRYPIVHRMLMSREKIQPEDLTLAAPHLYLNYSKITISESALLSLANLSDEHRKVIDELLSANPEPMYIFTEKKIEDIAVVYFEEQQVNRFISDLRNLSLAYRYNKISPKVDEIIRELLCDAGYYKKNMGKEIKRK